MNRKRSMGLFIGFTSLALFLYQNFTPSNGTPLSQGSRNAKTFAIATQADIRKLTEERHPYVENSMALYEVPVLPNLKADSSLNNPHRFNECKNLYTSSADDRMNKQIFNVQTYGAIGNGSSAPFRKYQVARSKLQVQAHDSLVAKMYTSSELEPLDEMDWIGIQSALVAAHRAGGGTVVIPDTGKNYVINRGIWVYSNVRLVWLTNSALNTHSFVELLNPLEISGSAISGRNPYVNRFSFKKLTPTEARAHFTKVPPAVELEALLKKENEHRKEAANFVCKAYLYEPRVKAMLGVNGIGFARGIYDVQIYGGFVKDARYGTPHDVANGFGSEGGKGIRFESGVQQAIVDGARITDSTFGLSAAAGLYISHRSNPVRYSNSSDKITFRNVSMNRVDLPFNLGNSSFGQNTAQSNSIAAQSILIENFDVSECGRLSFQFPKSHPGAYQGNNYSLFSGIIGLSGGSNVTVRNTKGKKNLVSNSEKIGALIRGYGRNIDIQSISLRGDVSSLIDLYTAVKSNSLVPHLENFRLSQVNLIGNMGFLVHFPSPLVKNQEGNIVYIPKFEKVTIVDIQSTKNPEFGFLSSAVSDLKPAEISSPNLIYEVNGRSN